MELHVEADAETGKPPLLLVHGLLSSRNHWLPNAALGADFRLIRVDLPGHGLSPAPEDPACYRPGALAAALERVRLRLGLARWSLCGQSFGAGITLRYALDHPERVTAQVFTNANGALRRPWSDDQAAEHAARIAEIRRDGHAALRRQRFHPAGARRFAPAIRETLSRDADAVDLGAVLRLLTEAIPHLSVRDRFARTIPPTLLVNGRWESAFQPARAWAAAALPALETQDLEGGHSINIEQSAAFDAAARGFLLRHAARPAPG